MQRLGVIVNPNSKKNRGKPNRRQALQRIVGECGLVIETPSVDHIGQALARFEREGVDCWISDGGDGAFHWMVNTAWAEGFDTLPAVLPANGGTIDFVAKKAGVRGTCERILEELTAVCRGADPFPVVEVDTFVAEGQTVDGREFRRTGFACAAGGIGQRFFDKYYEHERPGPLAILRVVTSAVGSAALLRSRLPVRDDRRVRYAREIFRPTRARVTIDGERLAAESHGAIHAGSIDVALGGVFRVFPLAREPGLLHLQAGRITPAEMIANLPRLYRGQSIKSPTLVERAGRRMDVEAIDEPLAPVIDGEQYSGLARLSIRVGERIAVPSVRPRRPRR